MIKIENTDVSYKEILVIDSDADKHTCDCLGISDDGKLLFVKEKEANSGNAYYLKREFFLIDNDEYFYFLGVIAKNIRLERSISKGTTVLEVRYKGMYFKIGSSIRYVVQHKECSIFTADMDFAEEHNFGRIDKFEYEKTVQIKDCEEIRITHFDTEAEVILMQTQISPAGFETWIDTLH